MVTNSDEKDIKIDPEETGDVDFDELEKVKEEVAKDEKKRFQFYEKLRSKLADKAPKSGMMSKITDYLFLLPDFFMLLCRLMVDDRVENKTKGFILGVIGYVILPIDIIPDFIPVIGFVDDLIIVVYALDQILKYTDEQILLDNWSGKGDLILSIRKIIAVVDSAVGQKIIMKIKSFLAKSK